MLASALAFAIASVQVSAPTHPLFSALKGAWVGFLEYEDYQGPGRVRIAVMCRVTPEPNGISAKMRLVFDEGPGKIMEDNQTISLDLQKSEYVVEAQGEKLAYRIEGLDKLDKNGFGTIRLYGKGTSSDKPVDVRLTLSVNKTKSTMLRETRSGTDPFKFGAVFVLNRVVSPSKS